MTNNNAALDQVFHALSDKTRRAVIRRLSDGPITVSELAAPFGMALPSFMQHLKVLERSGLIRSTKAGRIRTCELEPATLDTAEDWLIGQRALWSERFDRLDAYLTKVQQDEDGVQAKNQTKVSPKG
ncbi:ArsR/SmtB family transcription factor [Kordiimonas sp.]|uniref:ArsR/SmtB family transcription factor n=1 Tax=Kordiimonas sp. TaxID=1970157 RepID=UPI003A925A82